MITFKEADNAAAAPSAVVNVGGHQRLNPEAVDDLMMVLRYKVEP